jgi:hypothetical protein
VVRDHWARRRAGSAVARLPPSPITPHDYRNVAAVARSSKEAIDGGPAPAWQSGECVFGMPPSTSLCSFQN